MGTRVQRFPNMRLLGEPELQPHPIMRAMSKLEVALR